MTDLTTFIEHLNTSSAQTLTDLEQVRQSLSATVQQIQRAAALTQFDQDALRAFLAKPYLVRPLGADEYELIVPKFIGTLGGRPVRTDGAFLIFRVNRFINLINPVLSLYSWQGKIEKGSEVQLVIKTRHALFEPLRAFIRAHHPYEVPEIIGLPVLLADEDYLNWLNDVTQ